MRKQLSYMLQHSYIQKILNGFTTRIEDFGTRSTYNVSTNKGRILIMSESILLFNKDRINRFIELRDDFEQSITCGNYSHAESVLDTVLNELGESIWYVRNRVLLLGLQGHLSEMQEFTDQCKKKTKYGLLTFIFSYIFLISHSKQALLHLNQLVIRNIDEFNRAGFTEYADLLALLFVPVPLAGRYNQLSAFKLIQSFNVIDQYTLFLNWAPIALIDNKLKVEKPDLYADVCDFISNIATHIECNIFKATSSQLNKSSQSSKNKSIDELVCLYERAEYEQLITKHTELAGSAGEPFCHINLAAKAYALTGRRPDPTSNTPIAELTTCLANLYALEGPQSQIIEDIESIAIRFNGLSRGVNIQLAIYKALPNFYDRDDAKFLANRVVITTTETTPLAHIMASGQSVFFDGSYAETDNSLIPRHREIKRKIRELIRHGAPTNAIEVELSKFSIASPLKKDVLELTVRYYMNIEDYDKALDIAANALAESSNNYATLPLTELITSIEQQRIATLNSLIVVYYYVQLVSKKYEYLLNETFEEYLFQKNVEKPSLLLQDVKSLPPKDRVFFMEISTPEIMDFLGCFANATELLDERLCIIYRLKELELIPNEIAAREIDDIVGRLVVDASVSEFNSRKIYVNDSAIKRAKSSDIQSLFDLYRLTTDQQEKTFLLFEEAKSETGISKALIAGDKNNTLLKMINMLIMSFLLDPKYGLDQNLSTEIRHGFFSNLMRSRPESRRLLCELDVNGEYKSNSYWMDSNSIFSEEIQNGVDDALKWFSKEFNALIAEASEWMKLTLSNEENHSQRAFDFAVYQKDFESARALADGASSFEQFMDGYIDLLWEKTEGGLTIIRERINGQFREKLDKIFDELSQRIVDAKGMAALHELTSAIVQTKSDIREDITTISDWFRRAKPREGQALPVKNIVEIAIRCFELVKGGNLDIKTEINSILDEIDVDGGSVKPLVISLINLLDNCIRYSGYGNETTVKISGDALGDGCTLRVLNEVCPANQVTLTDDMISEHTRKMKSPDSIALMRSEGGTGYCKIYNSLRRASNKFDVMINFTHPYFTTSISYATQNSIC